MDNSFKFGLQNSLVSSLSREIKFSNVEELKKIANTLSSLVVDYKNNGEKSTAALLENKENIKIFNHIGIEPIAFLQYTRATINRKNATSYRLKLTELADIILKRLLVQQDKLEYCWYYNGHNSKRYTTPWDTATCIYALHKINNHLKGQEVGNVLYSETENLINKRIESAINWLFDKLLFGRDSKPRGWNNHKYYPPDTVNALPDQEHNITVTAYILNILIRVRPKLRKNLELIIESTIVGTYDSEAECWVFPYSQHIDINTTCYCLRLLSSYMKYSSDVRTDFRFMFDMAQTQRLNKIRENAALKLAMGTTNPDYGYWKSQIKQQTDTTITALCASALYSCGFSTESSIVKLSVDWLINQLEYYDGNWCWTNINKKGLKNKSLRDTSIIASTIIKTCDLKKISKIDGVFLWLTEEINEKFLNDERQNINFAPLLCVFTEYLRFIDVNWEKGK